MNICQEMHQTVVQESQRFKEEQGRFNYVTPTSYLELLSIFSKIFKKKKEELIQAKRRTKNGLDKVKYFFQKWLNIQKHVLLEFKQKNFRLFFCSSTHKKKILKNVLVVLIKNLISIKISFIVIINRKNSIKTSRRTWTNATAFRRSS